MSLTFLINMLMRTFSHTFACVYVCVTFRFEHPVLRCILATSTASAMRLLITETGHDPLYGPRVDRINAADFRMPEKFHQEALSMFSRPGF